MRHLRTAVPQGGKRIRRGATMTSKGPESGPNMEGRKDGAARETAAPPPDDEWAKLTQREKFVRTARAVGADETGQALDEALRAVGRARKR